jgi:hypothetical protein
MIETLRLARIVRRRRRHVQRKALEAEASGRRLRKARLRLVARLRRDLTGPLPLAGFFAAGFLIGPPRSTATRGRLSIGSLAAIAVGLGRTLRALYQIDRLTGPARYPDPRRDSQRRARCS